MIKKILSVFMAFTLVFSAGTPVFADDTELFPVEGQIDDLLGEVKKEIQNHHKVLITTLTKRMAEDLTDYMSEVGIRVKYLHSDIDTLERAEIIRDLRLDVFDVLVGINLLREGLDIPEITLEIGKSVV